MGGAMLRSSVFRTVDFCTRRAWWVIVLALVLAAASTVYTARHFAIKTDVTDLFPPDLPWTQRAFDYMRSFPQPDILVVIDAPTPELVEEATTKLAQELAARPDIIMLDEFSQPDMRAAVSINRANGRPVKIEASGSVGPRFVPGIRVPGRRTGGLQIAVETFYGVRLAVTRFHRSIGPFRGPATS